MGGHITVLLNIVTIIIRDNNSYDGIDTIGNDTLVPPVRPAISRSTASLKTMVLYHVLPAP